MDGTEFPEVVNTAFVELVLEEYDRLLKYFSARISQRDEANDLVHEVYLRAVGIPADRAIESDKGYLWAVARSVLCRYLERRGRSVPLDEEDPVSELMLITEPTYEEDLDLQTYRAWLRKCWHQLPVKRRAVMELRWFHELSYEEIATRCGITVHAVHKHLKLGIAQLRRLMEKMDA